MRFYGDKDKAKAVYEYVLPYLPGWRNRDLLTAITAASNPSLQMILPKSSFSLPPGARTLSLRTLWSIRATR